MAEPLRIAIASYGAEQFAMLHETITQAGHVPVAYLFSRSMRPSSPAEPDISAALTRIISTLPPGMDLLLPGSPATVSQHLIGYRLDLLIVFGFNWRLPRDVLQLPRLGVLNVHPSALPRYRGPAPVLWAIRNGDPTIGLTVHRMDENIDAGAILAQVEDVPLPEQVTVDILWQLIAPVLGDLLERALVRLERAEQGEPQDETAATRAGLPPPDWFTLSWQDTRARIHHQVRVLRFLNGGYGPSATVAGRSIRIDRTSLDEPRGIRVECADGPLWITAWEDENG